MGWLNIYLSGVFINHDDDSLSSVDYFLPINPCVRIYVNDESVCNTTQLDNRSDDWVRFDQTYYSELIDKNSNITIKVFDVKPNFHGHFENTIQLEKTWDIASLLKISKIADENYTLILSASWRDEIRSMSQKEMEEDKMNE